MKILTSSNFKNETSKGKVIVDFYADWCGPCKMIAPIFEKLAGEFKTIKFFKVDVDASSDLSEEYEVRGIPCLIMFKDGKYANRIVGFNSESAIKEVLENF